MSKASSIPIPEGGKRLLRYAATGGTAAIVDLGGFAILLSWHLPITLAGTISFGIALLVNFWLSSRYVFHVRANRQRLPIFALGAVCGLMVNMSVTIGGSILGLAPLVAKALGIVTAFAFNYGVNVLVVYRR